MKLCLGFFSAWQASSESSYGGDESLSSSLSVGLKLLASGTTAYSCSAKAWSRVVLALATWVEPSSSNTRIISSFPSSCVIVSARIRFSAVLYEFLTALYPFALLPTPAPFLPEAVTKGGYSGGYYTTLPLCSSRLWFLEEVWSVL